MVQKVVVVVPTVRPECHAQFVRAWAPLFEKHSATLVTVWDGEEPRVQVRSPLGTVYEDCPQTMVKFGDLFCRHTDACRNLGFVAAVNLLDSPDDVVITLDDDVAPCTEQPYPVGQVHPTLDPIAAHLDALSKRVPISWMNTAHDTDLYLRGVPYGVRDEAPVMMSHGVWVGTPDFDGETQLRLEATDGGQWERGGKGGVPYSLPYYVGSVPRGVLFPVCGMNLAVKRDALPYLYFAPMGPDSGVVCPQCGGSGEEVTEANPEPCPGCRGSGSNLHRFADIWMGVFLKREFDRLGWALYTGASTVLHTRASDARKNFEQEKLGREWNEFLGNINASDAGSPRTFVSLDGISRREEMSNYFSSYADKRIRYAELITSLLEKTGVGS